MTGTPDERLVRTFFGCLDAGDLDGYLALFAPHAVQQIGGLAPFVGLTQIRAGNAAFLSTLRSLRHDVTDVWERDGVVVARSRVTYELLDGRTTELVTMTSLRVDAAGHVSEVEVLFAVTPQFEQVA